MAAWTYYEYKNEKLTESLCSTGNGYFCSRGAHEETDASDSHYPGTYMAGVFNKLKSKISEKTVEDDSIVNVPNWLVIKPCIDGKWLDIDSEEILEYEKSLDLDKGVLKKRIWYLHTGEIVKIQSTRFVSMADPTFAAIEYKINPEGFRRNIKLLIGIDGSVKNSGVKRYQALANKHLKITGSGEKEDYMYLDAETVNSKIGISARCWIDIDQEHEEKLVKKEEGIYREISLTTDRPVTIRKIICLSNTYQPIKQGSKKSYEELLERHADAWTDIWKKLPKTDDVILRLYMYHLIIALSPHNETLDAGIPARGLTGEAYRGHIFWDDVFVFPFYNLYFPKVAKSLLMYRINRLGQAKDIAKSQGIKGAMYPWQSASTGEEETPSVHLNPVSGKWGPDHSHLQRHVSLAIAYNIIKYHEANKDKDFMLEHGFEALAEIARCFASLSKRDPSTGKFEIHGVMGPNEFHEFMPGSDKPGLKNNAYTNIMTAWLMQKIVNMFDDFSDDEMKILQKMVSVSEIETWADISKNMFIPVKNGIIDQYEGFMGLKELDWDFYRKKYDNIQRMDRLLKSEGNLPDNYQVSKQADLLMAFYLLGEGEIITLFPELKTGIMKKCYDYYVKRTSHGSTLSFVVHSKIATDLGIDDPWQEIALKADVEDVQGGTTQEGIHLALMAAAVLSQISRR